VDLCHDLWVDLGGGPITSATRSAAGRGFGLLAHRTFIDPLLGLATLDLGLFALWCDRRAAWAALGAYLGGATLGLVARLRAAV
jgi:hypothetical protein